MIGHRRVLVVAVALCATAIAGRVTTAPLGAQGAAAPAAAQAPVPKIWAGAFTAAQVARGKASYEGYCARCHGLNLLGRGLPGATAGPPALKGDRFWLTWDNTPLTSLMSKIQRTMPLDAPASLRDDDYADMLAYVLSENAFPPGAAELTAAAIGDVQIVRQAGGAIEAPDFALVQVVGCLASGPRDTWTLKNTTRPVVTRDERVTSASAADAAGRPLGDETYELIGVSHLGPASHAGHRMEVRGLLSRPPQGGRIDVLSLQMVGETCQS